MAKIVVDTDVIIEYLRKNQNVAEFLINEIFIENIVITYITYIELIKGATDKISLKTIEKILADFPIIHHNKNSSAKSIELIKTYHLSHGLKLADVNIAALCIINKLPLLTLNTKDFRFIKELELIKHNLKPKSNNFWE